MLIETLEAPYSIVPCEPNANVVRRKGLSDDAVIKLQMLGSSPRYDGYLHAEDGLVGDYCAKANSFPLLNFELEQMLFRSIELGRSVNDIRRNYGFWTAFNDGRKKRVQEDVENLLDSSKTIGEIVFHSNMLLVVKIARHYLGLLPLSELIQEGNMGMMRSIDKFDYKRGVKFSTFATEGITKYITRAIVNQGRTIRMPVNTSASFTKVRIFVEKFTADNGIDPTVGEIRKRFEEEVRSGKIDSLDPLLQAALQGSICGSYSLNHPIVSVDADEIGELGDSIADPDSREGDNEMSFVVSKSIMLERTREILKEELDERQRRILILRFEEERDLEDIGREVGLSRNRISQIIVEVIKKLQGNSALKDCYSQLI